MRVCKRLPRDIWTRHVYPSIQACSKDVVSLLKCCPWMINLMKNTNDICTVRPSDIHRVSLIFQLSKDDPVQIERMMRKIRRIMGKSLHIVWCSEMKRDVVNCNHCDCMIIYEHHVYANVYTFRLICYTNFSGFFEVVYSLRSSKFVEVMDTPMMTFKKLDTLNVINPHCLHMFPLPATHKMLPMFKQTCTVGNMETADINIIFY